MDASTLAQQINDASEQLQQRGHRIIVRRLRAFLESGDASGAELFLVRARDALGANDGALSSVSSGLTAFANAGGEVARLVTDPAWLEGAAREGRFGRLLDETTTASGLGALADQLARQQPALAAGESDAGPPSRQVEPKALPPLPKAVPAAADADPRAPLGSIFKPVRPRAAVEAEVQLEFRSLDLDEGEGSVERPDLPVDAPGIPDVDELQASAQSRTAPESGPIEPHDAPDAATLEFTRRPTDAPMVLPELHAPPEMPMVPVAPAKKESATGLVIGVVLLLGLIAVGVYLATR